MTVAASPLLWRCGLAVPRTSVVNTVFTMAARTARAGVAATARLGRGMARRNTNAGGSLIALGSLAGAFGGGALGQPVIGLLLGFGAGTLLAVAIWLRDRAVR
jgi:hypothetical protein